MLTLIIAAAGEIYLGSVIGSMVADATMDVVKEVKSIVEQVREDK